MNKNAIKKYAIWARQELINRVSKKALMFGISKEEPLDPNANAISEKIFSDTEKKQRAALIAKIKTQGYDETIEEVAYTWFNRFAALRFMEVNGYLPSHVRVFTNDAGEFKPQILTEAIHLDLPGLDMDKVYALKEADKSDELFRYLIIAQCNALNDILPKMFQKINDYTELLLPDNLLREGSVIERLIAEIPEDDWRDQVQIIGWLYQYYNTEPKDKVFADLKKNIKISKEKIPAATQLFTPDWIVRYMVENSLGRLWLETPPPSSTVPLPFQGRLNTTEFASPERGGARRAEGFSWKYYLDEAEQEPKVQEKLAEIRKERAALTPENIRCIDPCMGSGHILCYLFDVLMQIYAECGYTPRDAVEKILTNNLYGLDIDDRAAQLAYFAVMMKARQYDRRFFSRHIQPKVMAIQESNGLKSWSEVAGDSLIGGQLNFDDSYIQMADYLIEVFHNAKEYGSILTIEHKDYDYLIDFIERAKQEDGNLIFKAWINEIDFKIIPLVQQAQILSQKYDVVVTNPPYMGSSNMDKQLSDFVKKNYPDYKSDLFSACMVKFTQMAKPNGYLGFLSPYVWMFISSYEKLRKLFIEEKTIETLIQFEYSAFEEATVPICTFVLQNCHIDKKGCYLRLVDYRGGMEVQRQKALEAISTHDKKMYFEADAKNFAKIPGAPVAYWVSEKVFNTYQSGTFVGDISRGKSGQNTGDNNRFLRLWFEISPIHIGFNLTYDYSGIGYKWIPYNKGGQYRRWYGNYEYVVNWDNDGKDIKEYATKRNNGKHWSRYIQNLDCLYKEGITWSIVTSGIFSMRYLPEGFICDYAGCAVFPSHKINAYLLGLFNTKYVEMILKTTNPTINCQPGNINNVPYIFDTKKEKWINSIVKQNIALSKADWDSRETSWDFEGHPLV
ncbi:MAG: BREX-1 system adenine-specific DNA-methyltransferase PglX [Selenomonadaceae bacterium]|nr:BREX-1 system adenine-specific DNA-methyltransferase PglX [Selenomonadaceae bacterium]